MQDEIRAEVLQWFDHDFRKFWRVEYVFCTSDYYLSESDHAGVAVTGIELNDSIDMSAAVYGDTDKLLCHDDELEGMCVKT